MSDDQRQPVRRKRRKPKIHKQVQIFLILLGIMGLVFISTTVILLIGLIPSFVAFLTDGTKSKLRSITVTAMNFAGCMPFVAQLWTGDSGLQAGLSIILDPVAIIIIYAAAGFGYVLDWSVSLVVSNILYQQGLSRQKAIKKRQAELLEYWGDEVVGVDPEGQV